MTLYIGNLRHSINNGYQKYTANVDNEDVWISFPENISHGHIGNFFVAVALLEAMRSNRKIEVAPDIKVTQELLSSVSKLQPIYHMWNRDLNIIQVQADCVPIVKKNQNAASFYSAGIDSCYSLAKHLDAITHVITLNGFESWDKPEDWIKFIEHHKNVLQKLGKTLIDVRGNYRDFSENRKISNNFQHGLVLGGISTFFAYELSIIPSSYTYNDLFPWGSHPLTDPMWGSTECRVIHDGADKSRTEKTEFITLHPTLLHNLQVCWRSTHGNCGTCPKCARTMITLKLLNMNSESLPKMDQTSEFLKQKISSQVAIPFASDIASLAVNKGDLKFAGKLESKIKVFFFKLYIVNILKLLLPVSARDWYHKLKGTQWKKMRVTMDSTK